MWLYDWYHVSNGFVIHNVCSNNRRRITIANATNQCSCHCFMLCILFAEIPILMENSFAHIIGRWFIYFNLLRLFMYRAIKTTIRERRMRRRNLIAFKTFVHMHITHKCVIFIHFSKTMKYHVEYWLQRLVVGHKFRAWKYDACLFAKEIEWRLDTQYVNFIHLLFIK